MKPYFDTSHLAGALTLVAVLCWAMIEAAHLGNSRQEATKVGGAGRRITAWAFLIAASAVLYLAPPLVPAAAIRPAAVAFATGFVILLAGLLLIMTGIGLASANWVGLAGMALLTLAGLLWRIHAEERALLTTLGDPYRAYAARHKRLVPLVW